MKREFRNHLLVVALAAAIIAPLYFAPPIHRAVSPLLKVLQVLASAMHVVVLGGFVLLVVFLVAARLYWRRVERRAARDRGEWWARPEMRGVHSSMNEAHSDAE